MARRAAKRALNAEEIYHSDVQDGVSVRRGFDRVRLLTEVRR